MSAVKEWFYLYSVLFDHMKETYGQNTLEDYLDYIADEANSDISRKMKSGGLCACRDWFADNFRKDGAEPDTAADGCSFVVRQCPAYAYMLSSGKLPGKGYCSCCKRLNCRIAANAGFDVKIEEKPGGSECCWSFGEVKS